MNGLSQRGAKAKRLSHSINAVCMAVFVAFQASGPVSSAPVTFRFSATIETVIAGNPFDTGLTFAPGDVIGGEFAFLPNVGNGGNFFSTVQRYEFSLNINGDTIATASYVLNSYANSIVDDFPFATSIDELRLGGSLSREMNGPSPTFDPMRSGFSMELWAPGSTIPGAPEILETASIPAASEIWNYFVIMRNLDVTLGNAQGGSVYFQALVGPFETVPEPSTLGMICSGVIPSVLFVKTRRRSRSNVLSTKAQAPGSKKYKSSTSSL